MLSASPEKVACELARMPREQIVSTLRSLDCDFKIDFTDEYLGSLSLERLRHVALAACLHACDQHLNPDRV